MKWKFFGVIISMALVFGMTVVGCDNGATEKTYYYEAFEIERTQYDEFMKNVISGHIYTFHEIQVFRQNLRGIGTFVESNKGVSESELKNIFIQAAISPSEYAEIKNNLDSVGNMIYFFQRPNKKILWVYFEKE